MGKIPVSQLQSQFLAGIDIIVRPDRDIRILHIRLHPVELAGSACFAKVSHALAYKRMDGT